MHELAVCQGLMEQVERIAASRGANRVTLIKIKAGPLSGIEPALLQQAFTIARAGTVAASANLEIETEAIEVRCRICGCQNEAASNRLLCDACGGWQVDVIRGQDLMLMSLELAGISEADPPPVKEISQSEEPEYV